MTRIVVVALMVCCAPWAVAQESDSLKRAKEAYAAGQALYEKGRFADAAAKFEEANSLSFRAGNLFNIGRCYEQLKDAPKALRAFREYLRLSPEAREKPELEAAISQLEGQLRQRGVQQVAVRAEPEGKARVRIDDRAVGLAPVVVELSKGSHVIEVSAEGYSTARQDFTVKLDHASDLSFTLERAGAPVAATTTPDMWNTLPPPPPPPAVDASTGSTGLVSSAPRKPYVWAWVTTALTLLAVGAGVTMGILELNTQNSLKAGTGGPTMTRSLGDTAVAFSWGANIGYGVGGAAGIASVLLFIFEGR